MIEELWQRLEQWGAANAPAMLQDLNPGASAADIADLENQLGFPLPEELRESLVIHNGESDGWPSRVFADYGAYLGTDRILEAWQQRQEIADSMASDEAFSEAERKEQIEQGIIFVDGPVVPDMFRSEWIPIMDCNGDVFWAIDLAPAADGTVGQVIAVDWEGCSWKVEAMSLRDFLQRYVERLEAGRYRIADGLPTMEPEL